VENNFKIGVISDTHGLLRPEVFKIFKGVDLIIHAGDIGSKTIISSLRKISKVIAVKGNIDEEEWAKKFPVTKLIKFGLITIFLIHNINGLKFDPSTKNINIIIYGHSHMPNNEQKGNVLYFNPGSAGKKRFNLPISVGLMEVKNQKIKAKHIYIEN
jgi:putative phosphoesterase